MSDRAAAPSAPRAKRGSAVTKAPGLPATAWVGVMDSPVSPFIAAFDDLPVGALLCTPDGDRPNVELHRILRAPADATLDRRTVDKAIQFAPGGRPAGGGKGPRPIQAALDGSPTADLRVLVRRLDGSTGAARISARALAARGELARGSAIFTAVDETSAYDADRLRDAFLGIVGHELRSPISTIVGAADLLNATDLEPEVRSEVLSGLSDEAHRLHRLIDQLIALADLDRRGIQAVREPVHIVHVVRRIVARRRRQTTRLKLEVREPEGTVPPVSGEEGFIEQVLDILLENAVKYAGRPSPVVVAIEPGADDVSVRVLDHGPGIPLAGPDPIFGLFQRGVDDAGSGPSGHGIGLFVARAVVEAMGGRIWARNRPAGGADVGFSLPQATE